MREVDLVAAGTIGREKEITRIDSARSQKELACACTFIPGTCRIRITSCGEIDSVCEWWSTAEGKAGADVDVNYITITLQEVRDGIEFASVNMLDNELICPGTPGQRVGAAPPDQRIFAR